MNNIKSFVVSTAEQEDILREYPRERLLARDEKLALTITSKYVKLLWKK